MRRNHRRMNLMHNAHFLIRQVLMATFEQGLSAAMRTSLLQLFQDVAKDKTVELLIFTS